MPAAVVAHGQTGGRYERTDNATPPSTPPPLPRTALQLLPSLSLQSSTSRWTAAAANNSATYNCSIRLNDRVLPFFAEQNMGVVRILTDRGTEYCGRAETHDYQ